MRSFYIIVCAVVCVAPCKGANFEEQDYVYDQFRQQLIGLNCEKISTKTIKDAVNDLKNVIDDFKTNCSIAVLAITVLANCKDVHVNEWEIIDVMYDVYKTIYDGDKIIDDILNMRDEVCSILSRECNNRELNDNDSKLIEFYIAYTDLYESVTTLENMLSNVE